MTQPVPINLATWPRREHWTHYRDRVPCTYSITVELDVTVTRAWLTAHGRKTYPAQIWALARAVNAHDEFRMTLDDGAPAVWRELHPMFTVLNAERETFAAVWTPWDADFVTFHDRAVELLQRYRHSESMFPQDDVPPNTFDVSSLPWLSFTAFALHLPHGHEHLRPIFTLGRYVERDGRTLLPLAVQMHHAAADGFHVARLIDAVGSCLADPSSFGG